MLNKLHSFNGSRYRLDLEMKSFASKVPNGALVLDAGSGEAPYRKLFSHTMYESADFCKIDKKYEPSTYICDLAHIPVEDSRFDFIIFNQVMEHLPEPKIVLSELFRILKPGGKMICSCPLFFEEHEVPYDFYRYTKYGLEYLLKSAGFNIKSIDWLEGYFGTLGYQFGLMSRSFPRKIWNLPLLCLAIFSSIFFNKMEKYAKIKFGMPKNYIAVVFKPGES